MLFVPLFSELDGQCGDWSRDQLLDMDSRFVAAVEAAFRAGLESRTAAAATYVVSGKQRAEAMIEAAWRYLRTNMDAGIDVTFLEVAARCPGIDPHRVYVGIKRRLIETRGRIAVG